MAYTRVNWVDNVTPLDQVNLNQMDAYIKTLDDADTTINTNVAAKVDKDSVVTAATRIVANKLAGGDANQSFRILGDGFMQWGAGGASALDTSFYRVQAGVLKSGGAIQASTYLAANVNTAQEILLWTDGKIVFANDTNLYRSSAGVLKTDGAFLTVGSLYALYGQAGQVGINAPGGNAGFQFGTAGDTNLYRSAADTLKTDDGFHAVGWLVAGAGTTGQMLIGPQGPGNEAGFRFGSAADANLYRNGTQSLRTDGNLFVGISHVVGAGGGGGYIAIRNNTNAAVYFGSADDVSIYRSAANTLKTDGLFSCANFAMTIVGAAVGGGQTKKFGVYDRTTGTLAGWVPIYDA